MRGIRNGFSAKDSMELLQEAFTGGVRANSGAMPARFPLRTQLLLGAAVVVFLLLSFLFTKSLIPIAVLLGVGICWMLLRSPLWSILGFMGINVLITLMPREEGFGGAPTSTDLALGGLLVIIIAYWFVKIRIIERQPLSSSAVQLSLMLFFAWAIVVTAIGITAENNPLGNAIRELLNLLPLLIIPVLYERYIAPDSKEENWIFGSVLASGFIVAVWNVLTVRNNLIQAYYLYQMGRGYFDVMLAPFIILLLFSCLMVERSKWKVRGTIALVMVEILALILSMTRNMYAATPVAMGIVWLLGNHNERKRANRRILDVVGLSALGIFVAAISYRIISILVKATWIRAISAQKLGNDLSLRMKFAEWSGEWHAIKQSPILGHGFGASFRIFDIVQHFNVWMTFSHSSYLYIVFKTGFVGALLFFIPFFTFLYKAFVLSRQRSVSPRTRITARACFACLIVLLFSAYLGPVLDSKTDLMWVGLIWGYILAVEKQTKHSGTVPQGNSLN